MSLRRFPSPMRPTRLTPLPLSANDPDRPESLEHPKSRVMPRNARPRVKSSHSQNRLQAPSLAIGSEAKGTVDSPMVEFDQVSERHLLLQRNILNATNSHTFCEHRSLATRYMPNADTLNLADNFQPGSTRQRRHGSAIVQYEPELQPNRCSSSVKFRSSRPPTPASAWPQSDAECHTSCRRYRSCRRRAAPQRPQRPDAHAPDRRPTV